MFKVDFTFKDLEKIFFLFADDTSLFLMDKSYDRLISRFRKSFPPVFDWINHNLFVYFSNTLLNKLYKLYSLCLYILLRLELNHLSIEAQQDILKSLTIIPFKYRLFMGFFFFNKKFSINFFYLIFLIFLSLLKKL